MYVAFTGFGIKINFCFNSLFHEAFEAHFVDVIHAPRLCVYVGLCVCRCVGTCRRVKGCLGVELIFPWWKKSLSEMLEVSMTNIS